MAPSRGLTALSRASRSTTLKYAITRSYADLPRIASDGTRKTQIYISRSRDPYLNLSIEHYLLQKSAPNSTILFLYTNRPCIVIGRNQNPWVEVNLELLKHQLRDAPSGVDLVRRRSGGGAVFHDEGNVNYCVMCPPSAFDRDKHAHMIVRALQSLGVAQAKVNERHDIVLDARSDPPGGEDINETALPLLAPKPRKISGSAYKLTRLRSLHHGTCLLSSPNIATIGKYLRSPARPYILARGVDSVSSPIANVGVTTTAFVDAAVAEFGKMYGAVQPVEVGGEEEENVPEIAKGLAELKSKDWIYLQTPQFTFSSRKTEDDARERPALPDYAPAAASVQFTARNGIITAADIRDGEEESPGSGNIGEALVGKKVHEIRDWQAILSQGGSGVGIARWLSTLFD